MHNLTRDESRTLQQHHEQLWEDIWSGCSPGFTMRPLEETWALYLDYLRRIVKEVQAGPVSGSALLDAAELVADHEVPWPWLLFLKSE